MNEANDLDLINKSEAPVGFPHKGMHMYRFFGAWLLVMMFATSSNSQTDSSPSTRWLLDSQVGSDTGYKTPTITMGVSIERPITTRLEVQGGVSFSPTKTLLTNDGHHLDISGQTVFWVTQRLGVTASLSRGYLWTSQFNLQGWTPSAGVAVRVRAFDSPGRLYLTYLIPTGCQWGAGCPIQSNRKTGAKVYWENRISKHWRFGFEFGVYHVLYQGNSLDPAAGRTGQMTGDAHIVSRFEFPGGDLDEGY
jgi:hypothetical protein